MRTIEVAEGDGGVVHRFLDTILPHVGPLHRLSLEDGPLCSRYWYFGCTHAQYSRCCRDVHLLTGLQQLQELELGISLADPAWQQHLTALTDLTALKSLEIEVVVLGYMVGWAWFGGHGWVGGLVGMHGLVEAHMV